MEADADVSDGPDTEECYSSTEDLNSSVTLMNCSSGVASSSMIGSVCSSAQDPSFNSSLELGFESFMSEERSYSRDLSEESPLALPLMSSQDTVLSSSITPLCSSQDIPESISSELPLDSSVDIKSDSSVHDDKVKDTVNKNTLAGFFNLTKADILKAMKVEVSKVVEAVGPNVVEAKEIEEFEAKGNRESPNVVEAKEIEEFGIKGSEETEAKYIEEIKAKDNEETETKVIEESIDCVDEEAETKVIIEEILAQTDDEIAQADKEISAQVQILAQANEDILAQDNEEILAQDNEEILAQDNEEILAQDNEEILAQAVEEIAQADKEILAQAIEERKAEDNTDAEARIINKEIESKDDEKTEGTGNGETVAEVDVEMKVIDDEKIVFRGIVNECSKDVVRGTAVSSANERTKGEVNAATKADISQGVEAKDALTQEQMRCAETNQVDVIETMEVEPDVKVYWEVKEALKESTELDAGTSELVKAGTSSRFVVQEDNIDFGCNESQDDTDSVLDEEAKRLDKLDLPSQISPAPEVQVGENQRDKQYKKLVDLLSKSKFYTDVLLKKVEADFEKYSRKRKHPDANKNGDAEEEKIGSPSKQSSPSKRKKILMENQRAMCQVASEVIKNRSNKTVDATAAESQSTAEVKPSEKIQQPKLLSGGTLRDYQLEGFNWFKVFYENGVNGILADEMGLGKTIQVIALLCHLVEMKIKGPFLIVGPLSTLPNWMIEFKRFAPQLHVTLFYGNKAERQKMVKSIMKRKNVNGVSCFPIVLTSYEIPVLEKTFMEKIKWKYIIVDEGHKIKNYNTLLAKVLRTFDSANRLLLTGTPLQNSLSELWALLNFLVPEIFDNLEVFESWFKIEEISNDAGRKKILEEERRKNVLSTLHQILGPFMLRRVKSEVTLDIPKKKEVVVQAPMTDMQLQLYQALLDKNIGYLRKIPVEDLIIPEVDGKRPRRSCTIGKNYEEKSEPDDLDNPDEDAVHKKNDIESIITHFIRVKMQSPHVALKQIANHPYLIHYPLQKDGKSFLVDEAVVKSSGKFLVLDAMLEKLHAKGHKVLLFSTLCMLLDIVEDYLTLRNYSYERLDGNVKIADRADSIQRFNSDPNIFLFLLSTRAGGLGVNLTGADTVIFLDSDWNPQADLQAQDRCHRIGQTKPVMVYRLITTGSIEEQILKRASAKRVLEKMVIGKGAGVQKVVDLEELKSILESRDHSEIVYTDGQVLTDEQLEKLLDRSELMD